MQPPDTFTPEERVWQQQSDRSKPHNEADDTFVNTTNGDLSEAEAVAIAKSAILRAHELPESALDHCRVVTNLYVTNQRPDYRRWFIQFQVLKEGSDSYVERFYTCVVDREGQVIGDPDIDEPTLEKKPQQRQPCVKRNWSGLRILSGTWNTASKMKTVTSANGPTIKRPRIPQKCWN